GDAAGPDRGRHRLPERLDPWPGDELPVVRDAGHGREDLVAERPVLGAQVEQRNFHGRDAPRMNEPPFGSSRSMSTPPRPDGVPFRQLTLTSGADTMACARSKSACRSFECTSQV